MTDQTLVMGTEAAEILGCSRQRVNTLANSDPSFPKPVAVLKAGRIWRTKDIVKYGTHRKPSGRPKKVAN